MQEKAHGQIETREYYQTERSDIWEKRNNGKKNTVIYK